MKLYNKILANIFILGILANGCGALALVDEHHQIQVRQEKIAMLGERVNSINQAAEAISQTALKPSPKYAAYASVQQKKVAR